jgi:hypothetical protein
LFDPADGCIVICMNTMNQKIKNGLFIKSSLEKGCDDSSLAPVSFKEWYQSGIQFPKKNPRIFRKTHRLIQLLMGCFNG